MSASRPDIVELTPAPDPWETCRRFADWPGLTFFDSSRAHPSLGRYSFLSADPVRSFERSRAEFGSDPFAPICEALNELHARHVAELPPFQGGAAGLLGYELGGCFERIPVASIDEFEIPVLAVGIYDWVIAWDHAARRAWLVLQPFGPSGRDENQPPRRRRLVEERLRQPLAAVETGEEGDRSALPIDALAAAAHAPGLEGLRSDFSRESYLGAVSNVIEKIRAGDIFQANLSQRLLYPQREAALSLYGRLRQVNPATFAAYFAWGDWQLASASPERFLCLAADEVETRPIKGTRRRGLSPEAELFTGDELRESEKDMAENAMIVDLLRNDLSRVCRPGSVRVVDLCRVEVYETVQHLVSEIRGRLREGCDGWDLLRATFPGGSITGAPKVRAMEIIAEHEPTVRGPYCGSLFYHGFDGWMDSSILIRTLAARRGWIQCGVGGGVVAQSDPAAEYAETLHKAAGMLPALDLEPNAIGRDAPAHR